MYINLFIDNFVGTVMMNQQIFNSKYFAWEYIQVNMDF